MIKIKNPSLELNWLPNSLLKNMPIPEMYIVDEGNFSGCYYHISSEYKKGAIFLIEADDTIPGTIAHEWRHCWQNHNGKLPENGSDWSMYGSKYPYDQAIVNYFTQQPHEMDALLFELKYAPNDMNLEWMEWIIYASP